MHRLRTPFCVLFPPRVVACASYLLSLHSTMMEETTLADLIEGAQSKEVQAAFGIYDVADSQRLPGMSADAIDQPRN